MNAASTRFQQCGRAESLIDDPGGALRFAHHTTLSPLTMPISFIITRTSLLLPLSSCALGAPSGVAPPAPDRTVEDVPLGTRADTPAEIEVVVIHPVVDQRIGCSEHPEGEQPVVGDALGMDCVVGRRTVNAAGRSFTIYYRNEGLVNEDWLGWDEIVLAPFDGLVREVHVADHENTPGILGKGLPGYVVFQRSDGLKVIYGHLRDITVAAGQQVTAGQPVAKIGNNGFSWNPHVHIGAWKGRIPYQLRFDLRALGALRRAK